MKAEARATMGTVSIQSCLTGYRSLTTRIGLVGAVVSFALVLVLAACAGPAAPAPTPTNAPKATPPPAVPTKAAEAQPPAKPAEAKAPAKPAEAQPPAKPAELKTVKVGDLPAMSTAGVYMAIEKGYFAEQGIKADLTTFDSGAKMIPPLGTGELDVGAAGTSPGLFNAVARDVNIKIVADKGNLKPGYGFLYLMARKDLWDNGELKTINQLKSKKVAVPTKGMAAHYQADMALRSVGLKEADIDLVVLSFPDQIAAFRGKAIDAAVANEPFVTRMVDLGLAVKLKSADQIAPNEQVAIIMYSQKFIERDPELAKRFMIAYIKGVRDYNDAMTKKTNRDDVIRTIIKYTGSGDPKDFDRITWTYINPNGYVDSKALLEEQKWYVEKDFTKAVVPIEKVVDNSFIDSALKQLGEYK